MSRCHLADSLCDGLLTLKSVFMCTVALFLSGYVIQQRTVENLREAIRPRAPRATPKSYLPDKFKARITELEDGSVVFLESEAEEEARQQKQQLIEIQHSTSQPNSGQGSGDSKPAEQSPGLVRASKKQLMLLDQIRHNVAEKSWAVEHPDPFAKNRVPITAAERRRLIKEELQKIAGSNELVYWQRRLW